VNTPGPSGGLDARASAIRRGARSSHDPRPQRGSACRSSRRHKRGQSL